MKSFSLKLLSRQDSKILTIASETIDVDNALFELLSVFDMDIDYESRKININPLQQKSDELSQRVYEFVEINRSAVPALHQLKQFIDRLAEGEFFYIFQDVPLDSYQVVELGNQLHSLNDGIAIDEIAAATDDVFGFILRNYNLEHFDGHRTIRVGEPAREKRVCRFCGRRMPLVSFNKKAHAISEALGNKGIVANEECDACNEKFGAGIESDLIAYLNIFRPPFKIKGKGSGYPTLKGRNFSFSRPGEESLKIELTSDGDIDIQSPIHLETYDAIVQQNVYRALCKYVVSVIPSAELGALSKTIGWINGEHVPYPLPKGRLLFTYHFFSTQPSLIIYIRKNEDKTLPHIFFEFKFAALVFVFIIPWSSKDDLDFVDEGDFDYFWSKTHFPKAADEASWKVLDLSGTDRRRLVFTLNFEQSQSPPNNLTD